MIFPQNKRKVPQKMSEDEIKNEPLTRFLREHYLASEPEDKVEFPLKDKPSGTEDIKVIWTKIIF